MLAASAMPDPGEAGEEGEEEGREAATTKMGSMLSALTGLGLKPHGQLVKTLCDSASNKASAPAIRVFAGATAGGRGHHAFLTAEDLPLYVSDGKIHCGGRGGGTTTWAPLR